MTEADLSRLASNLVPLERGILGARAGARTVSFPTAGHSECFEVEDRSFWFQHRNRCIVDLVERHPPPGRGPIFDVGGGNGFVSRGLKEAGWDTVLVEPGLEGSRLARGRGLAPVVCATVEDAGFAAATLPAVGVFDVVEHIEDDVGFVRTLASLLCAGGRLYVTVPAYGWLWSSEDEVAGHYRRYRLGAIGRLVEECGLRVEFASYFFAPLPLPIFLSRSLPARLGRASAAVTPEHVRDQHTAPSRAQALLQRLLDGERALLRRGRTLPFGSSCLIAATRG